MNACVFPSSHRVSSLLPRMVGVLVDLGFRHSILPNLPLAFVVHAEPPIAVADDLVEVELARLGEAGHQLGLSQWQGIAAVCLPQVVDLAVEVDDLLHLGRLGRLPGLLRAQRRRGARHDEHARAHLKDVRVPELALLGRQRLVDLGRHHVLDADEFGVGPGAIIEDALAYIWRWVSGRTRQNRRFQS